MEKTSWKSSERTRRFRHLQCISIVTVHFLKAHSTCCHRVSQRFWIFHLFLNFTSEFWLTCKLLAFQTTFSVFWLENKNIFNNSKFPDNMCAPKTSRAPVVTKYPSTDHFPVPPLIIIIPDGSPSDLCVTLFFPRALVKARTLRAARHARHLHKHSFSATLSMSRSPRLHFKKRSTVQNYYSEGSKLGKWRKREIYK